MMLVSRARATPRQLQCNSALTPMILQVLGCFLLYKGKSLYHENS